MISSTLEQKLHEHLRRLPVEQQRQIVDFARALSITRVRGVSGQTLLSLVPLRPMMSWLWLRLLRKVTGGSTKTGSGGDGALPPQS
ncbi:MAG TPA: hypothetical protein VGD58_21005 [Herpetosiphonaceae bacterium]